MEFSKGKNGDVDNLPDAIELLMKAVDADELDEGINALAGAFERSIKR